MRGVSGQDIRSHLVFGRDFGVFALPGARSADSLFLPKLVPGLVGGLGTARFVDHWDYSS